MRHLHEDALLVRNAKTHGLVACNVAEGGVFVAFADSCGFAVESRDVCEPV